MQRTGVAGALLHLARMPSVVFSLGRNTTVVPALLALLSPRQPLPRWVGAPDSPLPAPDTGQEEVEMLGRVYAAGGWGAAAVGVGVGVGEIVCRVGASGEGGQVVGVQL